MNFNDVTLCVPGYEAISTLEGQLEWDLLAAKYPCCLCKDLLAVPVKLKCSHIACGFCVDFISSLSEVNNCCMCQAENLNSSNNEYIDSKAIIAAAKKIQSCKGKLKWSFRCQQYLQRVAEDKRRDAAEKEARLAADKGWFNRQQVMQAWIAVNVVFYVATWCLIVK